MPRRTTPEVVTRTGQVRSGAAFIAAHGHEREHLRAVSALWDAVADTGAADLLARVSLVLDRLMPADASGLFDANRRELRLEALLDAVRERYAVPARVWGRCADPEEPYAGAAALAWCDQELGLIACMCSFPPSPIRIVNRTC